MGATAMEWLLSGLRMPFLEVATALAALSLVLWALASFALGLQGLSSPRPLILSRYWPGFFLKLFGITALPGLFALFAQGADLLIDLGIDGDLFILAAAAATVVLVGFLAIFLNPGSGVRSGMVILLGVPVDEARALLAEAFERAGFASEDIRERLPFDDGEQILSLNDGRTRIQTDSFTLGLNSPATLRLRVKGARGPVRKALSELRKLVKERSVRGEKGIYGQLIFLSNMAVLLVAGGVVAVRVLG